MAQTIIPADWQIKRLSGSLGASVTGPNISHVSEHDLDAIKALLTEHLVLFFQINRRAKMTILPLGVTLVSSKDTQICQITRSTRNYLNW